jgi:hypothetical protein
MRQWRTRINRQRIYPVMTVPVFCEHCTTELMNEDAGSKRGRSIARVGPVEAPLRVRGKLNIIVQIKRKRRAWGDYRPGPSRDIVFRDHDVETSSKIAHVS